MMFSCRVKFCFIISLNKDNLNTYLSRTYIIALIKTSAFCVNKNKHLRMIFLCKYSKIFYMFLKNDIKKIKTYL